MFNDIYNKEDYEITLEDFKNKIDDALLPLVGVDVHKTGGIAKITSDAVKDCIFDNIEFKECFFNIYCPSIGENYYDTFGRIEVEYKEDNRKRHKIGSKIKKIWFAYTFDTDKLSESPFVCNISQVLSYDFAEKRKKALEEENKELAQQLRKNKEGIMRFEEIMKSERYK